MTLEKNHLEIWNYLKEIRVGMLTTQSNDYLTSRPMYLVQDAYEGVLWLFADKDAHKIDDIKEQPYVNMNFMAPDSGHFLSLSGVASVHVGGAQFEALWSDEVKVWFQSAENPKSRAVLIRVDVDTAEVWDTDKGMLRRVYEFAKAKVTGKRPDLGENKVKVQ